VSCQLHAPEALLPGGSPRYILGRGPGGQSRAARCGVENRTPAFQLVARCCRAPAYCSRVSSRNKVRLLLAVSRHMAGALAVCICFLGMINAFPCKTSFMRYSMSPSRGTVQYVRQCCDVALECSTATAKICVWGKVLRFNERILFMVGPWRVPGREEATRGCLPLKFIGIERPQKGLRSEVHM
jgi:hypothetical protein